MKVCERWLKIVAAMIACACLPLAAQQVGQPPLKQKRLSGPPDAQQTGPEYTLKTSVNRVLVDVVVTDAHGNAVHGLTKSDFTVAEDGVPQKVLAFDAHSFDTMTYVPPKMPALAAGNYVNLPATPERGPLYVLYYDLVNIPQQYQAVARAQLVKFIENKPEGARFAIFVASDGLHLVQGFTSDKQKLLAVVDPNNRTPHMPRVFLMGTNFGEGDKLSATTRLDEIAAYLAPMPGRKNLIWFASKFPLSLFQDADEPEGYRQEVKKSLNMLADEQIAVYPVDASGVVLYEEYATPGNVRGDGIEVDSRDRGIRFPMKPGPPAPGDSAGPGLPPQAGKGPGNSLTGASYQTQDEIARMTGGRAIYSTNNMTGALEKAMVTGGSYYTLAYSPTNRNFDGKLRHISVKLQEGGYHLSYRRAYFGVRRQKEAAASDPIEPVMKHGAPEEHYLIFGVHVSAGAATHGTTGVKGSKRVRLRNYAITYTVMTPQLRKAGDIDPQFEVAAAAFDEEGRLLNSTVNKTEGFKGAGAQAMEQEAYRINIELAVPIGAKFMRFAVRDAESGKLGVMEIRCR